MGLVGNRELVRPAMKPVHVRRVGPWTVHVTECCGTCVHFDRTLLRGETGVCSVGKDPRVTTEQDVCSEWTEGPGCPKTP